LGRERASGHRRDPPGPRDPRPSSYCRTLESQLGADDVTLPAELLDRIDEIVAPGVTLDQADFGYANRALEPGRRRR
jgi:hypothetical protein